MKKLQILSVIMLTLFVGAIVGCEQKSDLEKAAEQAAKDADKAASDASKKLGL